MINRELQEIIIEKLRNYNKRIHTSIKSSPHLFLENFYKNMGT